MSDTELISVIIPIYKVEKFLNKCIQSVVEQTYSNLEIILVDDGSPDYCPQICDEWCRKDDRIKVIHKANGGISDARNTGLAAATGEYIGFVDSDDYIEKEMYEKLYLALKSEKAMIAMCNLEKIKEDGTILPIVSPVSREVFSGIEGLGKILKEGSWYYIALWNKLYTREALKGIEFPNSKIHEDEFAFHRIYFQCKKIVSIEEKLYNYVQRQGSIMNGKQRIKHLDAIESICDRVQYYKRHDLREYYPDLVSKLKGVYRTYRIKVPLICSLKDWGRIQEIDQMFKESYKECMEHMNLKERIIYQHPLVWAYVCEVKKNIGFV